VSLVNPSGGSCGRTDSLLGDDLVLPRFAPLRAALRHDGRPLGAVWLRAALRRMARRRVGCALHTAFAASGPWPLRHCGGTHAPTPTGGRSASLRSPCLAERCKILKFHDHGRAEDDSVAAADDQNLAAPALVSWLAVLVEERAVNSSVSCRRIAPQLTQQSAAPCGSSRHANSPCRVA
jgi:hypothetical protein